MKTILLKDYTQPNYNAIHIDLDFKLNPSATTVTAKTEYKINGNDNTLILNGEDLILNYIAINDKQLNKNEYELSDKLLIIKNAPQQFILSTETQIAPEQNTKLEGLYLSNGNFCTQCEAEGFRRITYFQDRPDVMCTFTTTISANKQQYPIMLSNGNENSTDGYIDNGDGTHSISWVDPFKKPCYLFALVAGDLAGIQGEFTTQNNKTVKLKIYTNHGDENRLDYAMDSLIRAMKWDEKVWGRVYEHDIFHIVAVNDFNMGAMENTTLNIFNSRLILADSNMATDFDYSLIEGVVAHEYFHNWTGNRITCRDWFQLSLKEGLTVFRDQEFSSDERSRAVKRIADVIRLKSSQFKEDASPLAHPVRPQQYIEINNFYTATVYEKGAEVIRMLKTLLGDKQFYAGANIYFDSYDGTATTCDNWIKCMEQASGRDLSQFKLWYSQAGTPLIQISEHYDYKRGQPSKYAISLQQSIPNNKNAKPMHIPIAVGVLDSNGNELIPTTILELTQQKQTFELGEFKLSDHWIKRPVLSFNRGFSAPINFKSVRKNDYLSVRDELENDGVLFCHDTDQFNRWQAGQNLFYNWIKNELYYDNCDNDHQAFASINDGFDNILNSNFEDAFKAQCITMPSLNDVYQYFNQDINPEKIYRAYQRITQSISYDDKIKNKILKQSEKINTKDFTPDSKSAGTRALQNAIWDIETTIYNYKTKSPHSEENKKLIKYYTQENEKRYANANNMTIRLNALKNLLKIDLNNKKLADFYQQYHDNTNVMDKYFAIQATNHNITTQQIKQLMQHKKFNIKNPNKVRSLFGAFATNPIAFHNKDGSGYELIADIVIELNTINPQIGARLVQAFSLWKNFVDPYKNLMQKQLQRILATANLSDDIAEMVDKMLK